VANVDLYHGMTTAMLVRTLQLGGGTWLPGGQRAVRGFAVGDVAGSFALLPETVSPEAFGIALDNLRAAFPAHSVGAWLDRGTIHLDPVRVVETETEAREMGAALGQLAVYDLAAGREIRL